MWLSVGALSPSSDTEVVSCLQKRLLDGLCATLYLVNGGSAAFVPRLGHADSRCLFGVTQPEERGSCVCNRAQ